MLLVVSLSDPLGLECAQGGEGGGTLPDGELTVSRCDDLDLSASWGESDNFVFQSVWETLVHGGTTGEDHVLAEILSDINIGVGDGLPGEGVHGLAGLSVEFWLEEELWALHSDVSLNVNDGLIWESVLLVGLRRLLGLLEFLIVLGCDEAKFFLDVLDDFHLGR